MAVNQGRSSTRDKMRTIAIAALAFAVIAVPATSAGSQQLPDPSDEKTLYERAKAEGQISYYNGSPPEQTAALIKAFQTKYPGITVNPIRLVGPVLADRYMKETQAGQHIADVLYVGDYSTAMELIRQNKTASWKVPTYDRIPEANKRQTNGYTPQLTDVAIAYNTTKLTPEEVALLKSWKGVLDPRFKGRFGASTLQCGVCYAGVQLFLTHPEYGKSFLQAVANNKPKVFPSTVVALDRVVAGELDFVFWSFETAILPVFERGAPVRWVHPSPTPLLGNSWLQISATAPHPNAARLFANWMTGEDGAKAIMSTGGMPTLQGVKDDRAVTKESWYDPIRQVYTVDYDRWEKSYFDDMKTWADILKTAQ